MMDFHNARPTCQELRSGSAPADIPIPTAVLTDTWRSDLTLRLSGISILQHAPSGGNVRSTVPPSLMRNEITDETAATAGDGCSGGSNARIRIRVEFGRLLANLLNLPQQNICNFF